VKLWVGDRLAWPPVIAVAFLSVFLVATDFAWRVLVMPIGVLLLCALVIGGIAAVLLFIAQSRLRP
jgi:hypothetical protein